MKRENGYNHFLSWYYHLNIENFFNMNLTAYCRTTWAHFGFGWVRIVIYMFSLGGFSVVFFYNIPSVLVLGVATSVYLSIYSRFIFCFSFSLNQYVLNYCENIEIRNWVNPLYSVKLSANRRVVDLTLFCGKK